jgi:hypothetical protein
LVLVSGPYRREPTYHQENHVPEHCYRIVVSGSLGEACREAFGNFKIEPNGRNTALMAELDQSALYGALNRIQSLGLELVEVSRLEDDGS